jgi:peptidoglycan hydrolase CwlO-like protein
LVGFIEFIEMALAEYQAQLSEEGTLSDEIKQKIAKTREQLSPRRQKVFEQLRDLIERLEV